MSAPTNESYEIKRVQAVVAACISPLMHQLGGQVGYYLNPWEKKVMDSFQTADRWRKDDQKIFFRYDHHDGRHSEYVAFADAFYGPDSDFTEGDAKILENVNLKVDGKSKIFDNSKGGDPIHIAYEEEVDLENSVSTSLNQSFTFDTTVAAETTVSGSYAGASLEQKLSTEVHTGFSKETGKDTEESKTEAETVAIEFDCPPGGIKLLEVNKDHKRELIPTKGTFILDFSIKMVLYHWWKKAPGTKFRPTKTREFNVSSVEGLLQFAQGVDTEYPTMEGFWNDHSTPQSLRDSLTRLLDPANRSYELDADKMRVLENNATYKITDLHTPHGLGVDVIDLSDEEDREPYVGG